MKAHLPLFVIALLSAQLAAIPAAAQVLDSGSRVRATSRDNSLRFVGTFRDVTADTLSMFLQKAGVPQRLLISSLASLEESRGRSQGRGAVGVVVGGLLGAAAGFFIGKAASGDCGGECGTEDVIAGGVGAGVGVLVLGVVGYLAGARERWRVVNLDDLRGDH